jgi:pimeloyl-ACP methyl ester carboxylesterase
VVCLHGWTSNHEVYQEPAKALSDKARFILYEHRGHYMSKEATGQEVTLDTLASDLRELIVGLGLDEVTLVGWSMGATTILSYVDLFGCDRISQIVLCDMTPKKTNDETWKLGLYQGAYTAEDEALDRAKDFETLYLEYAQHTDPRLAQIPVEMLRMGIQRQMQLIDESVAMSLFNSMNETENRGSVAKIDVPLTYFYAVPGSFYCPELATWYEEQARVPYHSVAFPDSTHRFVTEHPDRFAEELAKLI